MEFSPAACYVPCLSCPNIFLSSVLQTLRYCVTTSAYCADNNRPISLLSMCRFFRLSFMCSPHTVFREWSADGILRSLSSQHIHLIRYYKDCELKETDMGVTCSMHGNTRPKHFG